MTAHVIFEFKCIDRIVRVSAIDTETGVEAVIQGPRSATKAILQQLALRKLLYLMNKRGEENAS